jgi:hypothetical protein
MPTPLNELLDQLEEAWRAAGCELGISIDVPFFLNGTERCVARLPDFGGPNGMLIGAIFRPKFAMSQSLQTLAAGSGYYVSIVNAEQYAAFDALKYQEALNDWGYFGPPLSKPAWIKEPAKS